MLTYIRNRNGHRVGVMLAVPIEGKVHLGWSLTCKKDIFNRELGIEIAQGRAERGDNTTVPYSIQPLVSIFRARCKRYFKDCVIAF